MNTSTPAKVWMIVGNSTRARLFAGRYLRSDFKEIQTFVHPESRLRQQELNSDAPGRTFDSFGKGRHSKGQRVDAKKQERINFALEVADFLEKSRSENKFEKLVVIASPEFMGELRSKLSDKIITCVELSIDKDLTSKTAEEIQQHIAQI